MSLGEFAKQIAALTHDLPGQSHLFFKLTFMGQELISIRQFRQQDGVAFLNSEASEDFVWENNP